MFKIKKKLLTSAAVVGLLVGTLSMISSANTLESSWISFDVVGKTYKHNTTGPESRKFTYSSTSTLVSEQKVTPHYFRNTKGKTFGSAIHAETLDQRPDYIEAYGVDRTLGYVKKEDLDGEMPKTREEAVAMTLASKDRQIPLYDVDGETIIGVFLIQNARTETFEVQSQK